MKKVNFNFRKLFIGVIALMCGVIVVSCGSQDEKVFKTLQEATEQINKSCPVTIDEITTVESTEAIKPRTLKYNVIVDMEGADSEADLELMKAGLDSITVSQVKDTPGLKPFREMDVTIVYSYKTTDGKLITNVEITPEQYK